MPGEYGPMMAGPAAERLEDHRGCLLFPGLIDAQVHASANGSADDAETGRVVVTGDADLDLDLPESVEAKRPGGQPGLDASRRRDGPRITNTVSGDVDFGRQQARDGRK